MDTITNVAWDEAALHLVLHGEDGPVARDLERRAIAVQAAATDLCPVDTGRLRASISHVLDKDAEGLVAWVGTNVEYGIYVEMGTARHAPQPFLRPALDAADGGSAGSPSGGGSERVTYTRKDGTTRTATRAQARHWSGGVQG